MDLLFPYPRSNVAKDNQCEITGFIVQKNIVLYYG